MEPQNALWSDRSTFESELDGLVEGAAAARSSSIQSSGKRTVKSELDGLIEGAAAAGLSSIRSSGKHTVELVTPPKRIKLDHTPRNTTATAGYSEHVHPSRMVLLDRPRQIEPNANIARDNSKQRRSSMTDHHDSRTTLPTICKVVRPQWDVQKDELNYESLLQQRRKERLKNVDRYVPGPPLTPLNRLGFPGRSTSPIAFSSDAARAKLEAKKRSYFPLEELPEDVRAEIFHLLLVSNGPLPSTSPGCVPL
ncbi:hypothetical protein LTR37_021499 [Vermiconidia calcicola]|uniref:Uncharacterized protein n=1 Tax=Vermiconidia calcicola TaxID=1690605 RepID=A0ACC3MA11_9PEZI|nr:hypothetical protein LTR37_021499 [Vermiconidia calcicola]